MARIVSCPHFPTCSGCSLIGVPYAEQLEAKLRAVGDLFKESTLRTFQAASINAITPSPKPYGYRNRVRLVPRRAGENVALGLFLAGSHHVVDIPGCPVQSAGINDVVEVIRASVRDLNIPLYDEVTHTGRLRFVTVREAMATGELLVGFVTLSEAFPEGDALVDRVMHECRRVVGVVQNINPAKGNVILGPTNRLLVGRDYLEEIVCDVRLRLGIADFFQINTAVAEKAYRAIVENVTGGGTVGKPSAGTARIVLLDLYAGVGTIGLAASRYVRHVYGIEESGESVTLAQAAARANGIDNVEFQQGLVEQRLGQLAAALRKEGVSGGGLAAVVNPPRKGLDPAVIDALLEARPGRIAYLSCAPRTLIRDLIRLTDGGYRVARVELFDMFPQTEQVETLVMLEWSRSL